MDGFKHWALSITAAAIVGAVVMAIAPEGGTEKAVRTAVSLFLLCAILSPFMSGVRAEDILGEFNLESYGDYELNEKIEEQMRLTTEQKIFEILDEIGIKGASVNIDISIDGENNVTVDGITVTADKEYSELLSEARREIKEKLGAEVETEVSE